VRQELRKKGAAPVFVHGLEDMELKAGASAAVAGQLTRKTRQRIAGHRSAAKGLAESIMATALLSPTTSQPFELPEDAEKPEEQQEKMEEADEKKKQLERQSSSKDETDNSAPSSLDDIRQAVQHRNRKPCRPKFLVKPKAKKELEEGRSLRLKCAISANPLPTVYWDRAGVVLETGNKFSIYNDGDFYYLEVHHVSVHDQGFYNCTATNTEGIATSSSEVEVVRAEAPKRRTRKEPKAPQFIEVLPGVLRGTAGEQTTFAHVTLADEGSYACVACNQNGEAKTQMKFEVAPGVHKKGDGQAPLFRAERLKDRIRVRDGQPCSLEAEIIEGSEPLTIKWLRDGVQIEDSTAFRYSQSGKICRLAVADAFPEDAGQYSCEARNQWGVARCLPDEKPAGEQAPKILDAPASLSADLGMLLVIKAKIVGHPDPVVEWHKGTEKVINSDKYKMTSDGESMILTISDTNRRDAGKYKITASNHAGQTTHTVDVTVREPTPNPYGEDLATAKLLLEAVLRLLSTTVLVAFCAVVRSTVQSTVSLQDSRDDVNLM
ncbi:unnamed protein product, partial [Mesorhabditis spiculigera]